MPALPAKNILDGTKVPATKVSEMKLAMGGLWDFLNGLLGATGTITDARLQLQAAKSGANSDITSLTGLTGSILVGGNGLVGYKAGAGEVVFQNTSKSTNVTLNKQSGVISINNSNLNAGASVSFTLANSFITESSLVLLNRTTAFGSNAAYAFKAEPGSGGVLITIKNETASNLAEAFNLNFAVISISQT